jgi:hypothetical protein
MSIPSGVASRMLSRSFSDHPYEEREQQGTSDKHTSRVTPPLNRTAG